jgi:hypothetical protein
VSVSYPPWPSLLAPRKTWMGRAIHAWLAVGPATRVDRALAPALRGCDPTRYATQLRFYLVIARRRSLTAQLQDEQRGAQEDQRIRREYGGHIEVIETVVAKFDEAVARIDKERPIKDMVGRIKKGIRGAAARVIADLTDERPSCYCEAAFAAGLPRPVAYRARERSIVQPGTATKIYPDKHTNVHFFPSQLECAEKLTDAVERNEDLLLSADQGEADGLQGPPADVSPAGGHMRRWASSLGGMAKEA